MKWNALPNLLKHAKTAYGWWNPDPDLIAEFPAQELIRTIDDSGTRDWPQTWIAAGGALFEGRMIALKDSPIWKNISIFGLPYPPFDLFDNMDVEDVDIQEAERLGVLRGKVTMQFEKRNLKTDLRRISDVYYKSHSNPNAPPLIMPPPPGRQ